MTSQTPPLWSEVSAVFGGRFDPPHRGHREAVRGIFKYPGVQRVLVVPSATPPHKPAMVSSEDRAEMARIAFGPSSAEPSLPADIHIDRCELDRAKRRPDLPSYTYDTLLELRQKFNKLAFVLGSDQLEQLTTWNRFPEILSLAHWVVLERKPFGQNQALKTLSHWESSGLVSKTQAAQTWNIKGFSTFLTVVPTEAPKFSSSEIRESIARTGSVVPGSIIPEVLEYLKVRRLYGISGEINGKR